MARAGGKIGYIALYSCQGPDASNLVSLRERALSCDNRDMALVLDRCGQSGVTLRSLIGHSDKIKVVPLAVRPWTPDTLCLVVDTDSCSSGAERWARITR